MKCGEPKPADQFPSKATKVCTECTEDKVEQRKRRQAWNREDPGFASRLNRGFDLMGDD